MEPRLSASLHGFSQQEQEFEAGGRNSHAAANGTAPFGQVKCSSSGIEHTELHAPTSQPFSPTGTIFLGAVAWIVLLAPSGLAQSRPTRITVLDFGATPTGSRAAAELRETLHPDTATTDAKEFEVIDRDQTRAAALGAGFAGSLNLTIQQARDIGSAMNCDFYFIGEAQTLRRSPSTKPVYYESYATVFLVSARTGRLVLWERPTVQRDAPEESEKALLAILSAAETRQRYFVFMRRAQENERAERVTEIGSATQII